MTQIVIRRRRPRRRSWAVLAASAGLIAGLAWVVPTPAGPPDPVWRRTRQGWEQLDRRALGQVPSSPALHPLCAAALEILLTAMALIAADRRSTFPASGRMGFLARPVPSVDGFLLRDGLGRPSSERVSGRAPSLVREDRSTSSGGPHRRGPNELSWAGPERRSCRRPPSLP